MSAHHPVSLSPLQTSHKMPTQLTGSHKPHCRATAGSWLLQPLSYFHMYLHFLGYKIPFSPSSKHVDEHGQGQVSASAL